MGDTPLNSHFANGDRCRRLICRMPRTIRNVLIILSLMVFVVWELRKGQSTWDQVSGAAVAMIQPHPSAGASRIAMVTFITAEHSYLYLVLKNKAHYAQRQQYDLYVDYEAKDSRGLTWYKFDMIERVIKAGQHDWIWWLDFDTLITNTTMSLVDIIEESLANTTMPDAVDFLVTDDCNGLNDGSFIARSSSRSIEILNAIRTLHDREKSNEKGKKLNDQESMRDFLESNDPLTEHFIHIPQWKINAFPREIGCLDKHKRIWEKGMLVVHFAGAWAKVISDDPTGYLMRRYEREIIW